MSGLSKVVDRLRDLNPETLVRLRPPYPPVALSVDHDEVALVRVKSRRGGKPLVEAVVSRRLDEECVPTSIFQPVGRSGDALVRRLGELFGASGTRPARVSVVLPDNLAKISLVALPERPASSRQLDELVRSKMRRAVPFRLEEAALSYQTLPAEGTGVAVLIVLVRKALVESFEQAAAGLGARVGLIDICTPNLLNLHRARFEARAEGEHDVALFNCTDNYFSLVIVRQGRLIFFRCKTFALEADGGTANGDLVREIAGSFSYYREKLSGQGIGTAYVRSLGIPPEEIATHLRSLGVERVELAEARAEIELGDAVRLDPDAVQRLGPAIGAASRGR